MRERPGPAGCWSPSPSARGPGRGEADGLAVGRTGGERVGFTVRGERKAGPRTVVEVVTTGVLLQRLQRDQELAGVETVVLDECHERHLDADTALAFLLDVRATLRPDLQCLRLGDLRHRRVGRAAGRGGQAPRPSWKPRVSAPGEVVWSPPPRPVRAPQGLRVDPALLEHVAATVQRALREREGDVLCFLPGAGEIARVAGMLAGLRDSVDVLQLHGRAERLSRKRR